MGLLTLSFGVRPRERGGFLIGRVRLEFVEFDWRVPWVVSEREHLVIWAYFSRCSWFSVSMKKTSGVKAFFILVHSLDLFIIRHAGPWPGGPEQFVSFRSILLNNLPHNAYGLLVISSCPCLVL